MPCPLRPADRNDPLPNDPARSRMEKLRDLVCGGPWGANNTICLIYWKPVPDGAEGQGEWVAWQDPDPLPPDVIVP